MPKLGYDISNIEKVFARMIMSDTFPTQDMLTDLKNEVNDFFNESECIDILYTNNIDKPFFGIIAMPVIDYDQIIKIAIDNDKIKLDKYYIEIDSKLFMANLTDKELTAYLLSEIYNLTIDDAVEHLRDAIDIYFCEQDKIINLNASSQYVQLLSLGFKDTILKQCANIYKPDKEISVDRFTSEIGYVYNLVSCFEKIYNAPSEFSSVQKQPKLSIMEWVFELYTNVKEKRIPALDVLATAKTFTGSALIKKEITNTINALNKIDTDIVSEASYIKEAATKKKGLINTIRVNGLKGIENDLYEFKIRIKNLETEEEAMYTLRQINARLTLLQDSLEDIEMEDKEYDKWYKVLEQYNQLREELSNKSIWNRKKYGIWYDYNAM